MSIREHMNLVETVHGTVTPQIIKLAFREEGSGSDGLVYEGVPVEVSDKGVKLYVTNTYFIDGGEPDPYAQERIGTLVVIGGSDLSNYYVIP